MRQLRYLLRLHHEGVSNARDRTAPRRGGSTIQDNLKRVAAAGLQWPLPEDVTDDVLEGRLFAHARGSVWPAAASGAENWRKLARDMKRPGVNTFHPMVSLLSRRKLNRDHTPGALTWLQANDPIMPRTAVMHVSEHLDTRTATYSLFSSRPSCLSLRAISRSAVANSNPRRQYLAPQNGLLRSSTPLASGMLHPCYLLPTSRQTSTSC